MTKEAKVKVELDTGPAKAELRKLGKEGEAAADRTSGSLGGAAALGAAAGVGFGLAQQAASRLSGFMPDAISEATVGFRAGADAFFGGPDARAARGAREQTQDAFREIAGRMKDPTTIAPDIKNYYNNVRSAREISERGDSVIDQMLGDPIGVKSAVDEIIGVFRWGIDQIKDALMSFGGK